MSKAESKLRPQLNLNGCYRTPEPRSKFAVKLVDFSNVVKACPLNEGIVLHQRELVPAKTVIVQVA